MGFWAIIMLLIKYGPTIVSLARMIWDLIKNIRDEREKAVAKEKFWNVVKRRNVGAGDMKSQLENLHAELAQQLKVKKPKK